MVNLEDVRASAGGLPGSAERVDALARATATIATAVALLTAAVLVGCAPASSPDAARTDPGAEAIVTLASVIDGDTIETSSGTVRIIGVDAPERDACGYAEAAAFVSQLVRVGDPIVLTRPEGQNDADRYGRLLRHVDTAQGVDVAAALLSAGLAVARYDGSDGYPAHPREATYHAAQIATLAADGSVVTVDCAAAADAAEQARIADAPPADPPASAPIVEEWWVQYTSCTKLKKNAVGHPTGPFSRDDPAEAAIYDWFARATGNSGDGDGDGVACE